MKESRGLLSDGVILALDPKEIELKKECSCACFFFRLAWVKCYRSRDTNSKLRHKVGFGMAWAGAACCQELDGQPKPSTAAKRFHQVVICIDNIYWTQEVAVAIEFWPEQ